MDIKRVQDSDKFAIIIDEDELGKLKEIMKIDGLGMSYPFYINIREYLQRLEYEKSQRCPAVSVQDIRRMRDSLDAADVPEPRIAGYTATAIHRGGLQYNRYIIDDEMTDPVQEAH